jgi:hypothetical protein
MGGGGAAAEELPSDALWPVLSPTPAVRQGTPRTETRKCGNQPAHQSLITDVYSPRLLPYAPNQIGTPRRADENMRQHLLKPDIRAFGPHRASPAAEIAGFGFRDFCCCFPLKLQEDAESRTGAWPDVRGFVRPRASVFCWTLPYSDGTASAGGILIALPQGGSVPIIRSAMADQIDDDLVAILHLSRTWQVMGGLDVVPIITHTLRQGLNVAVDHCDQVAAIHTTPGAIRLDSPQIGRVVRRIGLHPPSTAGT